MRLAFDLVTNLALHVSAHHFFELCVRDGETTLAPLSGGDTYSYAAMLLPDQPVVATGRHCRHDPEVDLCGLHGIPGKLIELDRDAEKRLDGLSLWLDNNLILSQGQLQSFYSLRVRADGLDVLVPLAAPFHRVSWEGQGSFRIDLAPLSALL